MRNVLATAKIAVTITVAGLLAAVSIAAMLLYIFVVESREELEFCAAIVAGAAVLYSGFYAGLSLRTSIEQSKRDRSFAILNQTNPKETAVVRIKHYIDREQELTDENLYCETAKLVSKWNQKKLLSSKEDAPKLTTSSDPS